MKKNFKLEMPRAPNSKFNFKKKLFKLHFMKVNYDDAV